MYLHARAIVIWWRATRVTKLIARIPRHPEKGNDKKIARAFEEGFFQYRKLSGLVLTSPPSGTAKLYVVCVRAGMYVCIYWEREYKRKIALRRGYRGRAENMMPGLMKLHIAHISQVYRGRILLIIFRGASLHRVCVVYTVLLPLLLFSSPFSCSPSSYTRDFTTPEYVHASPWLLFPRRCIRNFPNCPL